MKQSIGREERRNRFRAFIFLKKGMINMKQAKKKLTMAIGMAVGVTVLAGAAFASYNTSNGYEVGKNAIKGLLNNENYTANLEIKMSADGSEIGKTSIQELYDRNGDVRLNRIEKDESNSDYSGSREYKEYSQDGTYISVYNADGEEQTSVYGGDIGDVNMGNGNFDEMNNMNDSDKETADKIVRFAELAADTFVGDLKNNIVYVSGDDDSATYEINLDAVQIPELVNAGLSVMFSSMNRYDSPYMVLGTDPIVKNAFLKFTVDSEGRLTAADANVTMSGDGHEAAIDISGTISDYGTTKPQRVDFSTLRNIHTYGVTSDGNGSVHVNEDGNVLDEDGNIVGTIDINQKTGEGIITYNE